MHCAPPPDGAGFEQVLVSVPSPHVAEQEDHADQSPFTVTLHATPVLLAGWFVGLYCVQEVTVRPPYELHLFSQSLQ